MPFIGNYPGSLKMHSAEKTGKSLLFFHQGALGDLIVTFPVLHSLRAGFVRIDGVCRAEFGHLAKYLAVIDACYPQEAARFASLYAADTDLWVTELLRSYDRVLLFSFSKTLEASVRRAAADAVLRIPPWPREGKGIHVTEFLFHRLKREGLLPETTPTGTPAAYPLQNQADCRKKPGCGTRIILCPGSGSNSKRWPLTGYLQVADMLAEIGFNPEFVLGPAESSLAPVLSAGPAFAVPVHRPQGLVQLADLLQSADGYVGNDSAVSHLAAYLKIPAVVLFGPSDPDRWRPVGPCVTVLKAEAASGIGRGGTKDDCIDSDWLERISPAMVLESFLRLVHP